MKLEKNAFSIAYAAKTSWLAAPFSRICIGGVMAKFLNGVIGYVLGDKFWDIKLWIFNHVTRCDITTCVFGGRLKKRLNWFWWLRVNIKAWTDISRHVFTFVKIFDRDDVINQNKIGSQHLTWPQSRGHRFLAVRGQHRFQWNFVNIEPSTLSFNSRWDQEPNKYTMATICAWRTKTHTIFAFLIHKMAKIAHLHNK